MSSRGNLERAQTTECPVTKLVASNMATGGASAQSSTEEDATELQFPKGLYSPVAFLATRERYFSLGYLVLVVSLGVE